MRLFVALVLTGIAVLLQDCLTQATNPCPFANPPHCLPSPPYYLPNGQCNNKDSVFAGSAGSCYSRYLTRLATGGKGIVPYKSLFGGDLPLPRKVSTELFPCQDDSPSETTNVFGIFGTLLLHDMFRTARGSDDEKCCESCLGIESSEATDKRIKNGCAKCMPYKKPTLSYNLKCTAENQGKNEVTHPIDASFLYFSPDFTGSIQNDGKFGLTAGFLPIEGAEPYFSGVSKSINENPLAMALYHVFLREHNKIVEKMTELGVADHAEAAKKLMVGIFQHITYDEYLPLLFASTKAPADAYDEKLLPMVSTSFSIAYKLVVASMSRETVQISSTENKKLVELLNDASKVNDDTKMTNIVQGMLKEASLKIGRKVPCSFRDNCKYSDIVSVLTQDTRYLAVPPYVIWLAISNKPLVTKFQDLPFHDDATKTELSKTYKSVFDIDFLSGVFSETPETGKSVGKTLTKLMHDQFTSNQKSDKFYFEHSGVFEAHQLTEIKKVTMALLLCRNVANLDEVKPESFKMSSVAVSCSKIPEINFCSYVGIKTTWSPFSTSPGLCRQFQIEFRTCESTKPDVCPCAGNPFKISPCPGQLISAEMMAIYNLLAEKLNNDTDAMKYYKDRDEASLFERALALYNSMLGA